MTKEEKLAKLDDLVLGRMIDILEAKDGNLMELSTLNTAVQYLRANNIIEDKKNKRDQSVEERIREAEKRRRKRQGVVNDDDTVE